ncbi:hypothetical protein [Archangium sp.]|uniref:hypothetical protein n=1 Tax=Archangium sp. TaxID=1872627 RepID=UPI002D229FF0|nr:hypothetical protein [Archangium sp.]HYO51999.1 hypothetical protein [Archangium sp.]
MKRLARFWGAAALAAAVVAPLSTHAQARGRTDGPEGSEYGKGGYSRTSDSRFSLELNWGAAFAADVSTVQPGSVPLFFGATASLWGADWFQFDVSGAYVLQNGQVNLLAGPRFRTYGFPVSFNAGLKAGGFIVPDVGFRFGLSPQVGVDLLMASERVLLGLGYALDIPLVGTGDFRGLTNRLFMNVGYRF